MVKNLSSFLVWLLLAASATPNAFAQPGAGRVIAAAQSRSHVMQMANKAPIVLEGRIVERRGLWDPKHEMILTANKIEVYTLLKGRPVLDQGKYVEVITLGGTVGDEGMGWMDNDEVNLPLNGIGVLFLTPYAANGVRPALGGAHYLQAASGVASFWRYDGSPWTGDENAAHVPDKGIYRDIPASIHAPLASAFGRPTALVPGFDAAHFASHNPFPQGQRDGAPAKKKTSSAAVAPAGEPQPQIVPTAAPVITSFSPQIRNAGTFDLLTITGSDFGPGLPRVFFTSANSSSGGAIECPAENILSASATRIEVYVPSNDGSNAGAGISAGTGEIYIQTSDGRFAQPPTQILTIPRSEITFRDPSIQPAAYRQTRLVNANGAGGYTFKYDASVYDNPAALHAIQASIQKWRCETLLNVGDDVAAPVPFVAGDAACNVKFAPSSDIGGLIMATAYRYRTCVNTATNARITYTTAFDIYISQDASWFYHPSSTEVSNGTYDFKSSFLHELGHSLGLNHVKNEAVLMNYRLSQATSRFYLSNEPELGGATSIRGRSAIQQTCTSNAYTAMQFLTSTTCQGPIISVTPEYYVVNRCTLLPSSVTLQASGGNNYRWASKQHFNGVYPSASVVTATTAPYTPIGVYSAGANGFGGSAVSDIIFEENVGCTPGGGGSTSRTSAYPNPSAGAFTIDYAPAQAAQDLDIVLFNYQGTPMRSYRYPANAQARRVQVNGLAPGLYYLRTVEGGRLTETQQVQIR